MELIRDIFVKMAEFTDKEISNTFPQKRLTNIVTNITNNITYYAPDIQDANAHIYRLCHDLKKFNVPVFDASTYPIRPPTIASPLVVIALSVSPALPMIITSSIFSL